MDVNGLGIVHYPHPILRHPAKTVRRVDSELRKLIGRMWELMYEAQGIGLAANQVNLPLRLFIANPAGTPDEGEEWTFLNPVLTRHKGAAVHKEGCLSLPELYADVVRPERVHLHAYDLQGNELHLDLDGLMARIAQHETDHLDGILFIDRLSPEEGQELTAGIHQFERTYESLQVEGKAPSAEQHQQSVAMWEQRYCR